MKFKNILEISLKPVINKSNGQINFSLKKSSLPKDMKNKLSKLKFIQIKKQNFKFK